MARTTSFTIAMLATLTAACGPKQPATTTTEPVADPTVREMPAALEARPFEMPAVQEATLSNGLVVRVVTNAEVPLWEVRLLLKSGGFVDPAGKEGLASATLDMMNEAAGERDAATLAGDLKRLGGFVNSSGGGDSSSISAGGPKRNLEAILDIWASVILQPTFPEDDWSLMRARRIAQIKDAAERPTSIAAKVMNRLAWGDAYDGRYATEASYSAISTDDMSAYHKSFVAPRHGTLLVGGDLTLDEIVPLLEARLASWTTEGDDLPALSPETRPAPEAATLFLVDKPGAAQSVLRTLLPVGTRTDADYYDFYMGNTAIGGAFTARLNMNLREDKGYTYGARCGIVHGFGPSLWTCSSSVATQVTKPSMVELVKEIHEALTTRPVTDDELAFFRSYRVNSFESSYETASSLLGSLGNIWTYDLPESWLNDYVPAVEEVTVERIQTALTSRIDPNKIAYIVVGDASVIGEGLAELGMPIVRLDRDGNPAGE